MEYEEDDEYEQEYEDEKVERKFNFLSEFITMVDYQIVR